MNQERDRSGVRLQVVRNGGGSALEVSDGELELVVRHKWDHGFLLIITLSMLCVGILLGLVASHVSAIERLEHDQDLALTWVQTHRHSAPGEQPAVPDEVKPILKPIIDLEEGEAK